MTTPTIPYYPITHDDGLDIVSALNNILGALNIPTRIIAEDFDSTVAYAIGDYCIYNGTLYRFTSAHAAGVWDVGDVSAVVVGEELALKAPLASPALTGTPTAPTAVVSTNTTQLATCEYVHKKGLYQCSGTIPQGSTKTFYNANIKSTMKIPSDYARFSDPSKVTSDVSYTTADGSITFTGTFTAAVTVYFDLMEFDTLTLT